MKIEELRALLNYNAETGSLTWRVTRRGTARAGSESGCVNGQGYRVSRVSGMIYPSHRLAWAIHHGAWPVGDIDHIDGVKTNNRISNLRDVTTSTNIQNQKRARSDNKSGSSVPGVCMDKRNGKFRAQARNGGRQVFLGQFSTLPEAEAASLEYRRKHYEGFTL